MNRKYNPSSASTRVVCAIAALLCTALMLGWIDGLADHHASTSLLASARPAVVVQR